MEMLDGLRVSSRKLSLSHESYFITIENGAVMVSYRNGQNEGPRTIINILSFY